MSLQGSLETFALPDVLVLLSSTKKDGELRVVGGRVDGRVWLEKGQIVHSVVGGRERPPVDSVFELLRLDAGTFSFEAGSAAPHRGEAAMIDLVLADAQVRLAEWNEIAKVVPHLDAVVDMAPDAPGAEVVISRDQWSLLRHVAGGCAVSGLMAKLGDGEFDACRKVKELVEARLATIDVSVPRTPAAEPAAASTADDVSAAVGADADAPKDTIKRNPLADAAPAGADKKRAPKAEAEPQLDQESELQRLAELAARDSQPKGSKVRANTAQTDQAAKIRANAPSPAGAEGEDGGEPLAAGEGNGQTADEAKALVAQLAAIGGADEQEIAEKVAKHVAEGGELPPVIDGDEPINRGLLLKFLSSVRN